MKRFVSLALALMMVLSACALAEEHYYGKWYHVNGASHKARCMKCGGHMTVDCICLDCAYEGARFALCPVCGYNESGIKAQYIHDATVLLYDYSHAPLGDLQVMKFAAPFGSDSEILAAYSVIFEYAGASMSFDGIYDVSFTVDVEGEFEVLEANGEELSAPEYTLEDDRVTVKVTNSSALYLIKAK